MASFLGLTGQQYIRASSMESGSTQCCCSFCFSFCLNEQKQAALYLCKNDMLCSKYSDI